MKGQSVFVSGDVFVIWKKNPFLLVGLATVFFHQHKNIFFVYKSTEHRQGLQLPGGCSRMHIISTTTLPHTLAQLLWLSQHPSMLTIPSVWKVLSPPSTGAAPSSLSKLPSQRSGLLLLACFIFPINFSIW